MDLAQKQPTARNFMRRPQYPQAAQGPLSKLKLAMLIAGVLACLLVAQNALAQTGRALVSGVIADSQGRVIPDAVVTATNIKTGVAISSSSNHAGIYVVGNLLPGQYTLRVERKGFRAAIQNNIQLVAEQHAGINFTLQPGNVQQVVIVTANSQMLQTETAELSTTIDQRAITQLPLNGRNPASLVFLTPGTMNVLATSAGIRQNNLTSPDETGASMNGGRQGSTYYLLDGAYNEDSYHLLAAPFPNPDAIQEFSVIGNNFNPRYGFTSGGVVSIVTKSGTNHWHGDLFEFLRNGAFNAKNYFSHQTNELRRNQFGGSIGGPIVKDKLFIFGNYQGTRENYDINSTQTYIPSEAMLNGDFAGICQQGFDSNGICLDRYPNDPTTVLDQVWKPSLTADHSYANALVNAYPNNHIDPSSFNPASVAISKLLPKTTDPLGHILVLGYPHKDSFNQETVRADYAINGHQHLSGRAFLNYYTQPAVSLSLLRSGSSWINHWQSYAGTYTWTISPKVVNNLTGSYVRMYDTSDSGLAVNGKPVCFSTYIKVNDTTPGAPCSMFLYVYGTGPGGGFGIAQNHNGMNRYTWGVSDTLSISKGKHLIATGIDVLHQYWYLNTNYLALPIIGFGGGPNGSFTGYQFSDFLLGDVGSFTQGGGESNEIHAWQIAPYIADQFKATPHLTISAGIRWEPFLAPVPASGRMAMWAPGQQSTRYPNAPEGIVYPGDKGVPSAGMPSSYGYVNPRVGIAWAPKFMPNTSVRAAFGMYSSQIPYSDWNHAADAPPFSPTYSFSAGTPQSSTVRTPIIPFSDPWSVYQATNYQSPFPPFSDPGYAPGASAKFTLPVTLSAGFAPHAKPGVTKTWNASIEQRFGSNWLATFAYVGSHSTNQILPIEMNPGYYNADPALNGERKYQDFSSVLLEDSAGIANYNAGQFSIKRRYANGLQLMANYTYSKTSDDASFASLAFTGSIVNPFCISCNYGNSGLNYPNKVSLNFVYEIPTPHQWNRALTTAIGGWQISGIWIAHSGDPLTIGSGLDMAASHAGAGYADFAPGNSSRTIHVHSGSLTNYLTFSDFTTPQPGSFGDVPKNAVSGPRYNDWDLELAKTFAINEQYRFQLRLSAFNAFNHPYFGDPETCICEGPSTFGQIFYSSNERLAQVSGKFFF